MSAPVKGTKPYLIVCQAEGGDLARPGDAVEAGPMCSSCQTALDLRMDNEGVHHGVE